MGWLTHEISGVSLRPRRTRPSQAAITSWYGLVRVSFAAAVFFLLVGFPPDVETLTTQLISDDDVIADEAAKMIVGSELEPLVLDRLVAGSGDIRYPLGLGRLAVTSPEASKRLAVLLGSSDPVKKRNACDALWHFDAPVDSASVIRVVQDESALVRKHALRAARTFFVHRGRDGPVEQLLASKIPEVRRLGCGACSALRSSTPRALLDRLRDKNLRVFQSASLAISGIGDSSSKVVAELEKLLASESDLGRRYAVAGTLLRLGAGHDALASFYLAQIKAAGPRRWVAQAGLALLGSHANAQRELRQIIDGKNDLRREARLVLALLETGAPSRDVVDWIRRGLKDNSEPDYIFFRAAGRLGKDALPLLPVITECATNPYCATSALNAIGRVGFTDNDTRTNAVVQKCRRSENDHVRHAAIGVLAHLGKIDPGAEVREVAESGRGVPAARACALLFRSRKASPDWIRSRMKRLYEMTSGIDTHIEVVELYGLSRVNAGQPDPWLARVGRTTGSARLKRAVERANAK